MHLKGRTLKILNQENILNFQKIFFNKKENKKNNNEDEHKIYYK